MLALPLSASTPHRPAPAAAAGDRVSSRSNPTAAGAGEKHAYSPGDVLDLDLWERPAQPLRGASQPNTHGPTPLFGFEGGE